MFDVNGWFLCFDKEFSDSPDPETVIRSFDLSFDLYPIFSDYITILLGIYPAPIFDVTAVSVKKLIAAYEAAVGSTAALAVP